MKTPLAIIDLDGTVRDTFNCYYPRANEVVLFPGIHERLMELKRLGFKLVGATNQGGVSKGEISEAEVRAANDRTQQLLGEARFERIYYCPHYAAADGRNCDCKKPAPGMVVTALSELGDTTLNGSFVIGDDEEKDGGLAASLGLPFIVAGRFRATPVQEIESMIKRCCVREMTVIVPDTERVLGTIVGLAVADVLSAPLRDRSRASVRSEYPKGLRSFIASKNWEKGEYTDETATALMVAMALRDGSLYILQSFFKRWAVNGSLWLGDTPKLLCKDIGISTRAVLDMGCGLKPAQEYYKQHPKGAAGSGALVRCAPVALFYVNSLPMLIADSRRQARLTHADPKAQSSCVILNFWIRNIIRNGAKDARKEAIQILPPTERKVWQRLSTIETCSEAEISSGGYTVHTLEAAAWSFLTTDTFEEAVVRAANLGEHADSVAAVTGALAGAYYGFGMIPIEWREELKDAEFIKRLALDIAILGLREASSSNNVSPSTAVRP